MVKTTRRLKVFWAFPLHGKKKLKQKTKAKKLDCCQGWVIGGFQTYLWTYAEIRLNVAISSNFHGPLHLLAMTDAADDLFSSDTEDGWAVPNGYGSIPINTIFRGMNIHLPAILMFTRGTRFWHTAKFWGADVRMTWGVQHPRSLRSLLIRDRMRKSPSWRPRRR